MEESKATSEYIYEDDYSFINQENELFLKKAAYSEQRKLLEVAQENMEEKIQDLKKVFKTLQKKVEDLSAPDGQTIASIREELNTAEAIGDFDALFMQLDNLTPAEEEPQAPEDDNEENVAEPKGETDAKEPDSAAGDDAAKEQDEAKNTPGEEDAEDALQFYKDIVDKAKTLSKQDDWPYIGAELENLTSEWGDGPEVDSDKSAKLYKKFINTVEAFEKRKQKHYEDLKKKRQGNLKKKEDLLSRVKKVVDQKNWTATGQVGKAKNQWNAVGTLPSGKGEDLDKKFEALISTFNDHKVDRLVQKGQQEEDNLMLKLSILDKMEKIVSDIDDSVVDWENLDERFDDLTKQWKKVGRVPKEKSNAAWTRYKAVQDDYYDAKYKFDTKHQKQVDKRKNKKEQICKDAEALLNEKDLATAARKINRLHHRWKKVGNLPQRAEDKMWDRFKAATDSFNERKSDNIDKLREQEEQHYEQKLSLIKEAEELKNTEEWDKGHKAMQNLMKRWKKVGPVQRKKSNKIWKKFKGAMDIFYDRRRDHFKEQKEGQKENLKEKQEILAGLKELSKHEDPIEAVEKAKELQERFKDAGYVPINQKNKMWKQYREVCDVIYDRLRAAKSGNKFDQELAKAELKPKQRSKIKDMRNEHTVLKKEVSKLKNEVLQFQETKTYFKPSKKGNPLLDEVQQKIDKVENKLQQKQDKLATLTKQMEEITEH